MLRFLLWRLLGVLGVVIGLALIAWFVGGGPGRLLRGGAGRPTHLSMSAAVHLVSKTLGAVWGWTPAIGVSAAASLLTLLLMTLALLGAARWRARGAREYLRLEVEPYRTDHASAEALVSMFDALHKRLLQRWWRRLLAGQPAVALEVHQTVGTSCVRRLDSSSSGVERAEHPVPVSAWLAVCCPREAHQMVESALRVAYPNCRVRLAGRSMGSPPTVLRLKKRYEFIKRVAVLDHFAQQHEPPVNRLITAMGACGESAFVQIAMTPAPALFERFARHCYRQHEAHLARARREHVVVRDRSMIDDVELRGGLDVQHRPLFFVDLRVVACDRLVCERIASALRADSAENSLVERGTTVRHGLLGLYRRRVQRGEGNPLPSLHKGVFASTELAALWQLPSIDYATVPLARAALPLAPAPPGIMRPPDGNGALRDALGTVSIHVDMRKQNTAVPGTVEQGKSSYLVATVAEDLRRERCAVIVLDPKGDAADAAVSLVPAERTCTLLDLSHPTCGFNPLAVEAPADVIADYVVGALKNLFTDADIRASSDRYLRNAIIAVLAHDRESTLWDAARLLSVGEEGYAYRRSVGAHVRTLPEYKEISAFFTAELTAQLADARSTTTAKLDAPVNKLARLLNSPSIKRVLLNDSLRVDFDRIISGAEVLVVKGALGAMGAGNTSVLMQLLVGMLDAALARQQDLRSEESRISVALKIDEAPLVLNRGFAETMALKRSAGLETVACWQTDAQWVDREVRDQLDALFAHRVYFATASAQDARAAVALTMATFSDTVRPGIEHLSALGHPDVRLHLPKHHAIASWTTAAGRQSPFVAQTLPLRVDRERLALHAERQLDRGGRHLSDLRQPHWDRPRGAGAVGSASSAVKPPALTGTRPRRPDERAPERAADEPGPDDLPRASSAPVPARRPAGIPPESYQELVALDGAASVRWAKHVGADAAFDAHESDLEMLELIALLSHVLTSQIHRRFNPGRAATTTQRRLKRLADAGLLRRFQFHRRDGGGIPMCCAITPAGLDLLEGNARRCPGRDVAQPAGAPVRAASGGSLLRQARLDVHAAGWVLALQRTVGAGRSTLRGREEAVMSPPLYSSGDGRAVLSPSELRLPGGMTPHDFIRTGAAGEKMEADRFETLRPDAVVEIRGGAPPDGEPSAPASGDGEAVDVLVELDDRIARGGSALAKLERYDHFLAGWAAHTRRYGRRREARPLVVFVCRDRARARVCARAADAVLRACRAYAGEYPANWEYPGRTQIVFASERDVHEGLLDCYGVPRLPPPVRVAAAEGDPGAAEASAERREMLGLCSAE